MAWVRFDPGFTRGKKRLKVGASANWLWVCSVDYGVQHMTDGQLPAEAVPGLVPGLRGPALKAAIEALLGVGAWKRSGNDYIVHAFLEYQESADEVRSQREAGKARARRSRERGLGNAARAANPSGRNAERAANAGAVTPNVRDSAVLSCPGSPPTVPPSTATGQAVPLPTRDPRSPTGAFPPECFRTDCPDKAWHGRCVDQAYAAAHPGAYPVQLSTGLAKQCPAHRPAGPTTAVATTWP
jgi:hypothetical protein